ncbi:hypothetical protein CK203_043510 [Vitis vinifera]|uniref:DUF4283 domain-containing protein n=1 Tax=Vitis vinifera TaxID=29760 RepID=A0A438HR93_VITVI|nr:hypothetical protein CK203_043510 [Vitis vinifera]
MGERERERKRERGREGRESACDGDDEETGEASRRRSFTVESKTSNLPWMIGKGNARRWEKEWKEGGKLYTLARGFNRAGVFKIGGCGSGTKGFAYSYREGEGQKRWTAMVEMVRQMEEMAGRRTEVQEVRTVGRANPAKSYVEAVRRTIGMAKRNQDEVTREEIAGNLQKLEHCLVVSWKSEKEEEDDLERLGSLWANSWGLKGKLGLAKLERGKALLEFEDLSEARRVASSGSRLMGGAHLGLELWNPKTGCRVEEEMEQIAWIWMSAQVDGEIQWARILVKTKGDFRPSLLEIEVEDEIYSVALWWEIRPVVNGFSATENRRNKEVRGELHSRAEKRVGKELVGAGIEELQTPVDGSDLQENGPGPAPGLQFQGQENRDWASPIGRMAGPAASGPNMGLSCLAKFSQFLGFSTEGLEKEILSFLIKIRKRREKIHSKELLEKSKFERELKRLECSVNYEGGNKQKGNQDSGDVGGYCEKLGLGRFLDWRALNAEGAAGGILICWDKRVLEFWIGRRVSFPCLVDSRSQKMGLLGFLRVCMAFPKWKGREQPKKNQLSHAEICRVVDDLELVDLPLQGGEFTWSGGLNNQAWARLDRFLVSLAG